MMTSELAKALREIADLLREQGREAMAAAAEEAAERFEAMVSNDRSPGSLAGDK